ncbi:hypothetical protein ACHQM5_028992 [Ranunculus cassubicifolius]
MAEFTSQLKEIQTLISSISKTDKSFGYANLLHFQEQSTQHPSIIEALSENFHKLLPSTISDIAVDDEEISSQALKCLGFMIYHPALVVNISEDNVHLVVESVVKLITTTKLKTVCNLGVWCISIQQLNASLLAPHFHSLLRAVIYALDNPTGSLSTTYEAIQAVIKLVSQLGEKMRETANIWAPAIYRRLISSDKRQRDITERCLMKIRSVMLPPPLDLSKAIVADLKKKLLSEMKEVIQDRERKVNTIQAWGWYIRLLGPFALKNRQLVNEMLKIPEQTFSDSDPQVQIASQVAWEGLIDALIQPPAESTEKKMALEHVSQKRLSMALKKCDFDSKDGISKSLRLIMTPLVGIMSSKCDISVHSSCLNTWCYLLHRLDLSVNHPSVLKTVIEPILEAVFQMRTDDKKMWNFCLDLLDDFIFANNGDRTSTPQPNSAAKCHLKDYPIKWGPWDLNKLDFHVKIIQIIISQGSMTSLTPESRSLIGNAALRAFGSALKGIQIELKKSSVNYSEIVLCINTILSLAKAVCEDATSKDSEDLIYTSLHFIQAIREVLDPSLLASPLYKVAIDFKYTNDLQSVDDITFPEVPEIRSVKHMDMVSPAVYLTVLNICMWAQSISNTSSAEIVLPEMESHLKFVLSSCNPLDNLYAIIHFLYKHRDFTWLKIWAMVANSLKEVIDRIKDIPSLQNEMEDDEYMAVYLLLSYPFSVCLSPHKPLSLVNSEMELRNIIEIWKSLCGSINCYSQSSCSTLTCFAEDLCGMLNNHFNQKSNNISNGGNENLILEILFGEVAIYLLSQILINDEIVISRGNKGNYLTSSSIKNSLEFISRYLNLSLAIRVCDPQADISRTSKVFSALARFISCLHSRHHILLLLEILSEPLVQCFSTYAPTVNQLQLLWSQILYNVKRSQPPIVYDSSFLKLQSPLLEKTLDNANSAISESTIIFWNDTYGNQIRLDYPQTLVPILDKLSRIGKLSIHRRSPTKYRVNATQNKVSKRVELMEDHKNGNKDRDTRVRSLKRKNVELTEHQKEVRRAQQGRSSDCSGHGPGIRTYTGVDFSQGNEDSQESQEIRNPEAILELLRKV